ncbi:Pentatricopeptide repeat-containing protein [Apostasia shenzhenica]|uniref:Pentatricopeptide repeat-containing protein n=1 Tax=Apostasia shenzhenica TaxID=1088818 RepID=A0A2H9ZW94_9ASPA|nr:Pentatricopeptide repeat-containing protein [Apostasia shenzhenica]
MSTASATLSTAAPADHRAAVSLVEKCRLATELRQIHGRIIKSDILSHPLVASRFVSAFSLSEGNSLPDCLLLYSQMMASLGNRQGLGFSLPSLLKSCGKASALEEGRQIHAQVLKSHLREDPFVSNSILRMYLEMGEVEVALKVFDKMFNRDVISWNSMISGCFKSGKIDLACRMFDEMPHKDIVSVNSMVDGLMKHVGCDFARELFEKNRDKSDVVTWTSMVSGYTLNGHPKEALKLFREMLRSGVDPDVAAIVNGLSAIADLGFAEEGRWIHAMLHRSSTSLNSGILASALIDMYSKCGLIGDACSVFRSISSRRRIVDWNSMLSGLALHGLGRETLDLFNEMLRMDVNPDEVTFLAILSACSHSGLVDEGQHYFKIMHEEFNISPRIKHYGCMIDLFGRAGLLENATRIIDEMPVEPDSMIWKSLLSSCIKHGYVAIGEAAAMKALELAPLDSSCYVLLSNLYANAGKWSNVAKIRAVMKARKVRKNPGCSSVMIGGSIHEFFVGKEMGTTCREVVRAKLEEVIGRLKMEGYRADLNQVIVDVDEEEKEGLLVVHSEKMAIAFGLASIDEGAPIRVMKNLRVCGDCHSFSKLVSRVYNQEIILRDQNRFHHFKGGTCSCNDYW